MNDTTQTTGGAAAGQSGQANPAGQGAQVNPPRPGQPVPAGGLDPTQVFASPPPPPPSQTGDGTEPVEDKGPPPPPAGPLPSDELMKQYGYDDEDLRILKEVGDYRFGSITAALTNDHFKVPQHPQTQFDETLFLSLLRGSISLTRDEKWRIIQAIPNLSQFQISELQKILDDERKKFSILSPKHLSQLQKLEQKHADDWRDLQSITIQEEIKSTEEQKAAEIKKQLGL